MPGLLPTGACIQHAASDGWLDLGTGSQRVPMGGQFLTAACPQKCTLPSQTGFHIDLALLLQPTAQQTLTSQVKRPSAVRTVRQSDGVPRLDELRRRTPTSRLWHTRHMLMHDKQGKCPSRQPELYHKGLRAEREGG